MWEGSRWGTACHFWELKGSRWGHLPEKEGSLNQCHPVTVRRACCPWMGSPHFILRAMLIFTFKENILITFWKIGCRGKTELGISSEETIVKTRREIIGALTGVVAAEIKQCFYGQEVFRR